MLSIVFQLVFLALYLFIVTLLARFVMSYVMMFGRRWRPGRGAAAMLELMWSVTDPPLKTLRRVIPPLRLGSMSLDLASIVLLIILYVLMVFVVKPLIDVTNTR